MKRHTSPRSVFSLPLNRRSTPFLLLGVLLAVFLLIKLYKNVTRSQPKPVQQEEVAKDRRQPGTSPADGPAREERFNRRVARLSYSQHARCRMGCRRIDESEVQEILVQGRINMAKSEPDNPRSPRYALEGTTHDRQRVRIVFAQDPTATTVVTVIDLDTDWTCDCK